MGRLLFDEVALVAVVLWLLPRFGINIPVWLLIVFMVAWAVYACLTSRLVAKVIGRAVAFGSEVLIGVKCTTTKPLSTDGYMRVGTELWRARSMAGDIETGAEVIIVNINRLTLLVKPSTDTFNEGWHNRLETDLSCAQNEGRNRGLKRTKMAINPPMASPTLLTMLSDASTPGLDYPVTIKGSFMLL